MDVMTDREMSDICTDIYKIPMAYGEQMAVGGYDVWGDVWTYSGGIWMYG